LATPVACGAGSLLGGLDGFTVRASFAGEDFSIFNETTLAVLEMAPELRGDPDLDAINEGITIVWLK